GPARSGKASGASRSTISSTATCSFSRGRSKTPQKRGFSLGFSAKLVILGPAHTRAGSFGGTAATRGEHRLVQDRRQGRISESRCRDGRQKGVARGSRDEARVSDDQDPAQRHDSASAV